VRFLLLSADGDGLGVGLRLRDEGHEVIACIRNPKDARDYDGMIRKVDKFDKALTPDTIVIFDCVGMGKMAERLRGQGYAVFGASMFADQLELDRAFALGLMEDAGIKVPDSRHFTGWGEAIAYVKAKDARMALKADGAGAMPSFLADSPEQMIALMEFYQKEGTPADFELQDFVKGTEVSSEFWFDGYNFAKPCNHTFERKQMMNDNIGPSHGCSGNVVFACPHDTCRICQEGIVKMAPILRHHGFVGCLDLNTIVNEEGVWALEFTARFGYDGFPALMEMLTEPLGEVLARYARRKPSGHFPIRTEGFGSALRVSIPPAPAENVNAPVGMPIQGLVRADRVHSFFYNVMLDKDAKLVSSGAWGEIAAFTGFGDSIYSAMEGPLSIAKRVEIPSKMYRTDLSMVFEQCLADFGRESSLRRDEPVITSSAVNY
jgi:phosphoribosylamine--glycine ligase